MYYNNPSNNANFYYDLQLYERTLETEEQCNIKKFEIINKIKKMNHADKMFIAAIFIFIDKVTRFNNKIDKIGIFGIDISHQDFLVEFLPLMKNGLTADGVSRILNILENLEIVKIDKLKKMYSFSLDTTLYRYLLYNGLSLNSVFNKDCFHHPPPFTLMIVEFLYYYSEQGIPSSILAKFLDLPEKHCLFWINRLKVRLSLHEQECEEEENKVKSIKETDAILTEEEIMRRKTWYYNKIFEELEVDHTAYPIKDVTQLQDSYIDSKKKYLELLGKKDPNELYNLIANSGNNAEAIAAEAIMLLQARGVVSGGSGGEATITNTKTITFSNKEINKIIEDDRYTPEEKLKVIEDKELQKISRAKMESEYYKEQIINQIERSRENKYMKNT